MRKFLKERVEFMNMTSNGRQKNLDKEKMSERAVNLLKKLNFYHDFVIIDAQIFLKEADRVFSTGYEETVIQ